MTTKKLIACTFTIALASCSDTSLRPPPQVAFAEFDPTASPPNVPTPTDLARDPTTGKIAVPLPPNASDAEKELAAYLESLDAFPPESHAVANFSKPVANASMGQGTIIVLDLTTKMLVNPGAVALDAGGQRLSIIGPGGAWTGGHTFAVAIRSVNGSLKATDGSPVVASPAFFFARSPNPISNCTAPGPNCTSASPFIPLDQAIGLERLRQGFAPLFAALEQNGIPRNEIVLAWTFTISKLPFAAFDPTAQRIPFPNDILRNPMTGRVQLPINPDAPAIVANLENELNMLTGFSTTAPVTAPVDLPPGDTLSTTLSGVVTTMPSVTIAGVDGNVVLQPNRPLPEKTTFLNALTMGVTDSSGQPLQPPPLMVLLRGPAPLVADGHSTVSQLNDQEAAQLEPLRLALNQALAQAGLPPSQVSVAWAFTTQPTVSVLTDRVAMLPPAASTGMVVPFPANVPHTKLATLIAGTFTGSAGDQVPYLLTLPQNPNGGIVIFQHGLGSSKTAVFALANTFGQVGLATVAMDLPLHGDRAIPGREFLDFNDLGAIRESLLQSSADLVQLSRTLKGPGLAGNRYTATPGYVGVSLGGIVGTDFVAVNPTIRTVLSTTGAPLVDIGLTSPTFKPMIDQTLSQAGIQQGTPLFNQFVVFAKMELDAGDPINYAARLTTTPVLVQNASNDVVIPAVFGQRLAALANAPVTAFPGSSHALLINPMDPNIAAAQAQAVAFLLGGAE